MEEDTKHMPQINDDAIFFSAVVSGFLIILIRKFSLQQFSDFQAILGIFLLFVPVGYLFVSTLFHKKEFSISERVLLSASLSIALISLTALFCYFALKIPLNFFNSLALTELLCLAFYSVSFARNHLNISGGA